MKKSLLALAVIVAASANAATVYDKDGTTLAVGGRVQAVVYNGNAGKAGDHDANLNNSARLNMAGKTKLTDWVSALAFTEWEMANGNKGSDTVSTREQFVGLDFADYGKLVLGKTYDANKAVYSTTSGVVFDDWGARAALTYTDRRNGQIQYTYDNYGVFAKVAYQIAADGIEVGMVRPVAGAFKTGKIKADVEGGFSGALGYTFDNVVFGPLAIKSGYSYLKGQDDKDALGNHSAKTFFDTYKNGAFGVSWGSIAQGLYFGALLTRGSETFFNGVKDIKQKGYELVAGYKTDFGLGAYVGYNLSDVYQKGENAPKYIFRRVPVYVNYAINPHFNVWTEAEFDADSDKHVTKTSGLDTGTLLSLGARYTF